MKKIAILGSGVAGLHLAFALQQHETFNVTILTDKTPEEVKNGRVMSTQVHFPHTLEREQRYGMPQLDEGPVIPNMHIHVGQEASFIGTVPGAGRSVDQRLYISTYMEDLMQKGVTFLYEKVNKERLTSLSKDYDLVIDTTGKKGPVYPFEVVEELSTLERPLRKCSAGYFLGVKPLEPMGMGITVLPGLGELFEIPALTEKGQVSILFLEAVPGSELDMMKGLKTREAYEEKMLEVLRVYFPTVYERVIHEAFSLVDEKAFMQIAIQPVVRKPYATEGEALIVGCGDSVALNDPITGQGANTTSYCAEAPYLTLLEHQDDAWDLSIGEAYWNRIRPYVTDVVNWTNSMMKPLPEHVVNYLFAAAEDKEKADAFAKWFNEPTRASQYFSGQPSAVKA